MSWSKQIISDRIIPFPSFHPHDPEFPERIRQIKTEGFRGVKFHPYYQDFIIDDNRLFPVYEQLCEANLIVVMHTGYDLAFERTKIADPVKNRTRAGCVSRSETGHHAPGGLGRLG
jgi:predicted TIM-barrel fold metal-dependent hydrolase